MSYAHYEAEDDRPLLLSFAAGAAKLGIGENTLRRLVQAGVIPSCPVGTRRMVRAADLDHYVASIATTDYQPVRGRGR